ncbi:MAG: TetR/AcrR family transcriptional regulator [Ramlibacter sp.]
MTRQKSRSDPAAAAADPRANQKERTRAAVVAAATDMLRLGLQPTVAEAAERAKVSRATAYRYFPTQDALLVEVSQMNPAAEPVEQWLSGLPAGGNASARLQGLLATFNPIVLEEAVSLRTGLRSYLDAWLEQHRRGVQPGGIREGRRMRWLHEVLAPLKGKLPPARLKRLQQALSLTLGVEAMVVLKDVCQASDREALNTLDWAAQALLRAALEDAGQSESPSAPRHPLP